MMSDLVVFGDLQVPYFEFLQDCKNFYSEKEVESRPTGRTFQISDLRVRNFKDELVELKKKEAKEKGRSFHDGRMARLVDFNPDDTSHKLYMDVERTSYFTYSATNKSLDNKMVKEMMKKRGDSYSNLNDGLPNPIGVSSVVVSNPDNVVIIIKRSDKLSQYPGLFGIPGGFMDPDDDVVGEAEDRARLVGLDQPQRAV